MPWRLPSDDEALELLRRLDQLFADLYAILRSLVAGFFSPQIEPPENEDEVTEGSSVPDLLSQLGQEQNNKNGHAEDEERPPIR